MSAKRRVRETSEPAVSVRAHVLCGIRLKSVKKGRLSTRSHDTVWRVTTPSRPSNRCCTHHNSHGKCTRGNPRDAHVQIEDQGGRTARRRRSRSRGHCVSDAPPSPPSASASFCTINKHSRSCWELLTLGELIVFGGTCRDCVRHRGQLQLRPQRRYLLHTSMSQQKHPAMPAVDSETGRWAYDCSSGASRLLPAFGCVRSCLQKYPPVQTVVSKSEK